MIRKTTLHNIPTSFIPPLHRLLKEDICDETDPEFGVRNHIRQNSLKHSRIQKIKGLAACIKQQAILKRSTSIHVCSMSHGYDNRVLGLGRWG